MTVISQINITFAKIISNQKRELQKMASFGHFIKIEREKREWTQTDFGAKIGINSSAISRIENGTQKFSISKLKKLADVFEFDLQKVRDLFFADKFAKEAYKNHCSENVFVVAESTAIYYKNIQLSQVKIRQHLYRVVNLGIF